MTDCVIVSRSAIGVPNPVGRTRLAGARKHLLAHYTGARGYSDPTKDVEYAKSVARYGIAAGKTWEYNYLLGLGGTIFEQAGDRVGAHCKGFNPDSYGVLFMVGIGVHPTTAMIDSFRQLRAHLIATGALHPTSDAVPHYRYRSTACPGTTLAAASSGRWPSPTGEGSLGDLHAPLLMPWTTAPPTAPPTAQPTLTGDDMFLIIDPTDPSVYLVISAPALPKRRARVHITAAQFPEWDAACGPLCRVDDVTAFGPIVGS